MKTIIVPAVIIAAFLTYQSCDNDGSDEMVKTVTTDEELFDQVNEAGYQYYQSGNLLTPASASPHGNFKLRFNAIALSALDNSGELPQSSSFPNGSILVKEVYNNNNSLTLYAVMKKAILDDNSGNGWLWSEYALDGSVAFSVSKKGNGCISCHSDGQHRDLVRTFDLH